MIVNYQDYKSDLFSVFIKKGFNEINTRDESWKYNQDSVAATNILNQLFVNTVRMMGGNNTDRFLICGTYLNGTQQNILDGFVLPKDTITSHLIVAVHNYDLDFDQETDKLMKRLQMFSKRIGTPVLIDEFGTKSNYEPAALRAVQAGNFVSRAAKRGIKCFWWDDGKNYNT